MIRKLTMLLSLMLMMACKDKYLPSVKMPATGYLVVDGYINAGSESTTISLSRTTALDSMSIIPQTGAQVELRSENGLRLAIPEQSAGKYSAWLSLDSTKKYQLAILINGKEYLSDFTDVKWAPPIDTVSWKLIKDGIELSVSTYGSEQTSRYYEWRYEETWRYHSAYSSGYIYQNENFIYRNPQDLIYFCWASDVSSSVLIASTERLAENVVSNFPLSQISFTTTDRLDSRYSILVNQYVHSRTGYEWLQKLKKNSEQLGSIFSPMPTDNQGNIHCTQDPAEPVIGFVECIRPSSKRIFIDRTELPPVFIFDYYRSCELDTLPYSKPTIEAYFSSGAWIPVQMVYNLQGTLTGVSASNNYCVDCQVRGGTTVKPSFWK